ncbi:MAG: hypothetical protein Q3M24_16415 [Candidatus Electrothrix aestuarii]|uniref:Uncharacterized protein n=1 Tax=Candidatus Electrothrix aestuarii TaxID=3062594 RepID=A0AAU8LSJ2_9BACT|nr:hypothetical protein [Candidatus Electrothrix aestuarii]
MLGLDVARTLAVIRLLASGETITVGDFEIGMGEDMSIGPVFNGSDGEKHISGLSTMDLSQFHKLLNDHQVGHPIPKFTRSLLTF